MYKCLCFQKRLSISIPFILLISQVVYSQTLLPSDSLTAVLSAKENKMFTIITNGNQNEAEKLIGEDYITINADGVMEGKENTLKTIGKFKGSTAKLSEKKTGYMGVLQ
jgi:hypothetical protein